MIKAGELGEPLRERLPLVELLHEQINAEFTAGGSQVSVETKVQQLRNMVAWADKVGEAVLLESAEALYLRWADALRRRCKQLKEVTEATIYNSAAVVGTLLDRILDRPSRLVTLTKIRTPARGGRSIGPVVESQNLNETFRFGHFVQDLCDGLTLEAVLESSLPVRIPVRTGSAVEMWSGAHRTNVRSGYLEVYQAEGTLETRYPLANLRIDAELMMFIAQTGMNYSDAVGLRLMNLSYASYLDGYQVRERKARRQGEVLYEIFAEYKEHFERYVTWRKALFPDSKMLFPFIRKRGAIAGPRFQANQLRACCKREGRVFISARQLRCTRVNWLLRISGDPDLTADMAQHTKEVLLGVYRRPSQEQANSETLRFWIASDPSLSRSPSVAPGDCTGNPNLIAGAPTVVAKPDCIRASGCLFCRDHRDIDSMDYVWALASFRYIKTIEIARWAGRTSDLSLHPAQIAIDRIVAKMRWFSASSPVRKSWVDEAQTRIEEGDFHPDWIELVGKLEVAA